MSKKILISVDIEGISNLNERSWLNQSDKEKYHEICIEMTKDTNAAVEVCINQGFEVSVIDAHSKGENIIPSLLHEKAELLPRNEFAMMSHIDEGYDGVIFIGYHGMAGTNTFCAHTNSTVKVKGLIINNKKVSEGMTNAMLAKHFKVPVYYASGTDQGMKELNEFMPDLTTTTVLQSIDFENATTVQNSREKIKHDLSLALKTNGQTCNAPTENLNWDVTFNSGRNEKYTANIVEGFLRYREEMDKEPVN